MKKFILLLLALCCLLIIYAEEWSGTGFAMNGSYVVTNFHVVDKAKHIMIIGVKGDHTKAYEATVFAVDKNNDIAVLKVTDPSFNGFGKIPYRFRTSLMDVGERVWALGYPMTQVMGDEIKFTEGVVSSKTGAQGDVSCYQISVPIQPGNSGGPLFDVYGNVVGITSSGLNREMFKTENVNYAIKLSYLKILLNSTTDANIIPNGTQMNDLSLTQKIKVSKNFVFLINCSDKPVFNVMTGNAKIHNNHRYVDLGLSVYWADCNLGASSPLEYGKQYMWGSTKPSLTWNDDYPFYDKATKTYTKYQNYEFDPAYPTLYYGPVDNRTVLEPCDDAASVNWGGKWRMPTKEEFDELIEKCDISIVDIDGIYYFEVVGPNSNKIYMILGYVSLFDMKRHDWKRPFYWTATLFKFGCEAYCLKIDPTLRTGSQYKDADYYIRPVMSK